MKQGTFELFTMAESGLSSSRRGQRNAHVLIWAPGLDGQEISKIEAIGREDVAIRVWIGRDVKHVFAADQLLAVRVMVDHVDPSIEDD